MSAGIRVPYQEARVVADALASMLAPACERIEIAGSIRRGVEDIGDVELVAAPRIVERDEPDGLFDTRHVTVSALDELVRSMLADGVLRPHPEDPKQGERYMKLVHAGSGLQLDLFIVRAPAQFGVIHLIRTGPAGYSQDFVTRIRRMGWHVGDGALHVGGAPCRERLGPCEAGPPCPDEATVYRTVRLPWVNPEDRR